MKFIDQRNKRDFTKDIEHIKRLKSETCFQYYKNFLRGDSGILLVLTCISFCTMRVLRQLLNQFESMTLVYAYLAFYLLSIGSLLLTVGCILASGYRPYFIQRLAFEHLLFEMISSRDYFEILDAFSKYDSNIFMTLRKADSAWLRNLKGYCEQGIVSDNFSDCSIIHVRSNKTTLQLTMSNENKTQLTVPLAEHVYGDEPLLILTDAGAVLQLAS